ncbi:acyltransferase family protein [Solidesulfovibrio alcoholivorans]|uniref:acyltransferase family protein n=1 Tax=Solidesulfovibrio alcoholivorans TaxID=81406 RepID=UPI000497995C|nr:acyltransferase family protein [Solidesulfovibrio alcoholivorans]
MRYYSIQFLRLVFMAMVLYLHMRAYLIIYGQPDGTVFHFIPAAFMAAALPFFSISGFIMAFLIDIGYRNFLPRRLLRVYPTYFCGVAIALLVSYLVWHKAPPSNLFAAASLLPLGPVDLPLHVEWTLIYEIAYYVIISPFALPRLRRYFVPFLFTWAAAIFFAYYVLGMQDAYIFTTWRTVLLSGFNLYFITGALVYYLQKKMPDWHWSISVVTICACSAYCVLSSWDRPAGLIKDMREILPWSLCTAASLYAVVKLEDKWRHPLIEALSNFGDYAYAYYLIHAVILSAFFSLAVYSFGWPLNNATAFLGLFTVAVLGYGFGRLDMTLHNFFKKRLR